MRPTVLLAAAAAFLLPAAAVAAPAPTTAGERSFTRDGHTYVYTTTARPDGRTLIEGRDVDTRGRFRLLVDGTRVSGQANGHPVSFRAARSLSTVAPVAN